MARKRLQPTITWAEDRATQRCDPSADSGAETGVGIGLRRPVPLPSHALRDWHESDKPSRQDAVILPTRCRHQPANLKPSRFQFAVNQDTPTARAEFDLSFDEPDDLVESLLVPLEK